MKPESKFNSIVEGNPVLNKLFNQPNGFEEEIAVRKENHWAVMKLALETEPEFAFNSGACHIYAVCLRKADPRFALRVLSRHGRQDGWHVYCKMGEWAIDVCGPQIESELIEKWIQKIAETLIPCEVSESELLTIDRGGSRLVNSRGHVLDKPFLSIAIEKAEIHIAQHLTGWMKLINAGPGLAPGGAFASEQRNRPIKDTRTRPE